MQNLKERRHRLLRDFPKPTIMFLVFGLGGALFHFAIGKESSSNILDIIRTGQMYTGLGSVLGADGHQGFGKTNESSPQQVVVATEFGSHETRMQAIGRDATILHPFGQFLSEHDIRQFGFLVGFETPIFLFTIEIVEFKADSIMSTRRHTHNAGIITCFNQVQQFLCHQEIS